MPTQITSAGITFDDTTSLTSATLVANSVGTTQITNGSVIASKLGTNEQKQIAKAWVNFDGAISSTINSSFGISSITYVSTGEYQLNFSNPFTAANQFSVVGQAGNTGYALNVRLQSAGSVRVGVYNLVAGAYYNGSINIGVAIFGN